MQSDVVEAWDVERLLWSVPGDRGEFCRILEVILARASLLEVICDVEGRGLIVLARGATELFRTRRASALLEKWFSCAPGERALPAALAGLVERFTAAHGREEDSSFCSSLERGGETLCIELFRAELSLPRPGPLCLVSLREEALAQAPVGWRERLSPRQLQIASLILRGLSNEGVAAEMGCTVATVKKQVSAIFDRLGVFSRLQLCALAARQR